MYIDKCNVMIRTKYMKRWYVENILMSILMFNYLAVPLGWIKISEKLQKLVFRDKSEKCAKSEEKRANAGVDKVTRAGPLFQQLIFHGLIAWQY